MNTSLPYVSKIILIKTSFKSSASPAGPEPDRKFAVQESSWDHKSWIFSPKERKKERPPLKKEKKKRSSSLSISVFQAFSQVFSRSPSLCIFLALSLSLRFNSCLRFFSPPLCISPCEFPFVLVLLSLTLSISLVFSKPLLSSYPRRLPHISLSLSIVNVQM